MMAETTEPEAVDVHHAGKSLRSDSPPPRCRLRRTLLIRAVVAAMPSVLTILPVAACTGTHRTTTDGARTSAATTSFEIVAHRGVHVMWRRGEYNPITGCEAQHIYPPSHDLVENTIPAIQRAFDLGATIVEIDIRRTGDD